MKSKITEEDARKIFDDPNRQKEAEDILQDESKVDELIKKVIIALENIPLLGKFFSDVPTLCLIVKDYASGKYKKIPTASVIIIIIALVYFISPIDLIPDVIPVAGQLDDALVIAIAVGTLHNDIADYREWKGIPSEKILDIRDWLS